jgi:DNA-binding NarL/FixJ family response regulator
MTDSMLRLQNSTDAPASVLVVEDEALVALYLEDTLDALGYQCCGVADSAEEAISLAATQRPALALVDVGLRGSRDGIAVAAELADLGVAVVFLTGSSDSETRSRAEAVRPQAILSKPCSERDIAVALASAQVGSTRQ